MIQAKNRGDYKTILGMILKHGGWTMTLASPELQADKSLAMLAVEDNPRILRALPRAMRDDEDVVMTAMRGDCEVVERASERLRRRSPEVAALYQELVGRQNPHIVPIFDAEREARYETIKAQYGL